ncbi:MAG: glycoside hydrolase family 108 protein [Acidibrevibacterium sp.]|uniref:glycoside hydrolase family 108 protein n=1 Tax=Acidibrevibacterium sp. TaxID=2606776 RepID=UPI003D056A9B
MLGTEVFARCFAETIGEEGGFSADPDDPGNWSGGAIGLGACRGTKFGISAAAYPGLDIASLSLADAKAIYARDYWAPIEGDKLPPALAMLVFDAAVNDGVGAAARWLQAAVGVATDGVIGPATLAAVAARHNDLLALCATFQAARLAALPADARFLSGWRLRICRIALAAGGLLNAD